MLQNGKALKLLMEEMKATIAKISSNSSLSPFAAKLQNAAKSLHGTTLHLIGVATKNRPEVFLSDATLYLEFFGIVTVAWLWLKQGEVAQKAINAGTTEADNLFYQGKVHTMKYYFEYELPKIQALRDRLLSEERLTLDIESAFIN